MGRRSECLYRWWVAAGVLRPHHQTYLKYLHAIGRSETFTERTAVLYPTEIQVALLFDRQIRSLDELVQTFIDSDTKENGTQYRLVEQKSTNYYLFYGSNEQMISFEYINAPAQAAVFQQAVDSPVTRLMCPNATDAIVSHRSHILINVQHGAMGGGEIQQMLAKMGMDVPGNGWPAFAKRLNYAARIASMALILPGAQLVHWTLSNQLFTPDAFLNAADGSPPGPLHVHPYLFGGGKDDRGEDLAGILTFGVRHFLGREVEILPNRLPWFANWEIIFTFMRLALADKGYVIPDGDTFGNEDRTISYRVRHMPIEEGQTPLYQLEPLFYEEYGFQSPDYVPPSRRIDHLKPPKSILPKAADERAELLDEWRSKQAMAEGVGGSFEVKLKGDAPMPPPSSGVMNRLGRVFGRKGA